MLSIKRFMLMLSFIVVDNVKYPRYNEVSTHES